MSARPHLESDGQLAARLSHRPCGFCIPDEYRREHTNGIQKEPVLCLRLGTGLMQRPYYRT